jgi:hypothetical protein
MSPMIGAALLVALFTGPSLATLATAVGNGAERWPWPRGLVIVLALGTAMAALVAVGLGACGVFSLAAEFVAMGGITAAMLALGRFRLAWPFTRASRKEAAGMLIVCVLASATMLGRPFEMLLGERDATVYTVSGIALARQGSIVLTDRTADRIGSEAMRRLYEGRKESADSHWLHLPRYVKYPGFYYVDAERRTMVAQGLPLLPAVIAIFYAANGLAGAFAANNFIGLLATLSVFIAGIPLVGELAATLGASLLALDAIQVWASRYPVAEILLQMLLFAGFAAYLRGDRLGKSLGGLLLGATLFTKIEAALVLLPFAIYAFAARMRGRALPGSSFWVTYIPTALASAISWAWFQSDYVHKAYATFASLHSRMLHRYFVRRGSWIVAAMTLLILLTILGSVRRSLAARQGLARPVARGMAVGVVLFVAFGYWVRPHLTGLVAGQGKTLVWLSWYVSPFVLLVGFAGLAHYLWRRATAETLFVLAALMTLSAIFLHFTFVNLIQIYMTRRFVPATLPILVLFFGYAIVSFGASGTGRKHALATLFSSLAAAAAVGMIVSRSYPLYEHREYPGLAKNFSELASSLKNEDVVFLSDGPARNLLGPALEFVFGLRTLVVWPPAYDREAPLIREWIDDDMAIGALTIKTPLDGVKGAEEFEPIDRSVWWIRALAQAEDRFPTEVSQDVATITRYAAGRGSDPLYEMWRRDGERIASALCRAEVHLLGGNRFLLRRLRAACPASGVGGRTMGYVVGDAEAGVWQKALEAYGARFVRREFSGVVLFDEIAPRPKGDRLSPEDWTLEASDGRGSEPLAVDGRLDTRWGSRAPQRPGMTLTIGFPRPTDVSWMKIRMGRFATDRARGPVVETSVDGKQWRRQEIPAVVDGIRWRDGVPEENGDGDLDLWVNLEGLRALRLVNHGQSTRFDWSIAEIEIEGSATR